MPKAFRKEIYVRIHEWFGRRPQIQPPHVRDLLNPHDEVFPRGDYDSVKEDVDVVDLNTNETNIEGLDGTPNFDHVKRVIDGRDPPIVLGGVGTSNDTPLNGVTPILRGSTVLLSDSSHSISKRRIGNTAIRRKSSEGGSALLEVAKASGEATTTQMREMASVTKETESNKLEVQLRLFSEQMAYQRERDMRIYE